VPNLVAVDTFEQAEIHEGTFLIAVQIPVSTQPTVHLYEDRHQFTVTIDPGPAPHSARYVAFVVKDYVSERFAGITMTVGKKAVPLTLSGYHVKRPDDDEPVVDLKLVGNYPALQAPKPVFVRRFAHEERYYQWWSRSQ
jgi:hypothetical protein